jgi:hypothetical protein
VDTAMKKLIVLLVFPLLAIAGPPTKKAAKTEATPTPSASQAEAEFVAMQLAKVCLIRKGDADLYRANLRKAYPADAAAAVAAFDHTLAHPDE